MRQEQLAIVNTKIIHIISMIKEKHFIKLNYIRWHFFNHRPLTDAYTPSEKESLQTDRWSVIYLGEIIHSLDHTREAHRSRMQTRGFRSELKLRTVRFQDGTARRGVFCVRSDAVTSVLKTYRVAGVAVRSRDGAP